MTDDLYLKILIPSEVAGAIIGHGGEALEEIKRKTGARFKMSHANEFYPVPDDFTGMLIGKSGSYIEKVEEVSGTTVQVSNRMNHSKPPERCIIISGSIAQRRYAAELILIKLIHYSEQHSLSPYRDYFYRCHHHQPCRYESSSTNLSHWWSSDPRFGPETGLLSAAPLPNSTANGNSILLGPPQSDCCSGGTYSPYMTTNQLPIGLLPPPPPLFTTNIDTISPADVMLMMQQQHLHQYSQFTNRSASPGSSSIEHQTSNASSLSSSSSYNNSNLTLPSSMALTSTAFPPPPMTFGMPVGDNCSYHHSPPLHPLLLPNPAALPIPPPPIAYMPPNPSAMLASSQLPFAFLSPTSVMYMSSTPGQQLPQSNHSIDRSPPGTKEHQGNCDSINVSKQLQSTTTTDSFHQSSATISPSSSNSDRSSVVTRCPQGGLLLIGTVDQLKPTLHQLASQLHPRSLQPATAVSDNDEPSFLLMADQLSLDTIQPLDSSSSSSLSQLLPSQISS